MIRYSTAGTAPEQYEVVVVAKRVRSSECVPELPAFLTHRHSLANVVGARSRELPQSRGIRSLHCTLPADGIRPASGVPRQALHLDTSRLAERQGFSDRRESN